MHDTTASIRDWQVGQYLDELASAAPAPGGGAAAALSGATAAALISMVCVISGPKAPAEQAARYTAADADAQRARQEFSRLADADIAVFSRLAAVYRLPRGTDDEKAFRRDELQAAGRAACDVPLAVVRAAHALLPWCSELAEYAPKLLVSDIGVAVSLLRSTIESAALNVAINLAGLRDADYIADAREIVHAADAAAQLSAPQVLARITERITA